MRGARGSACIFLLPFAPFSLELLSSRRRRSLFFAPCRHRRRCAPVTRLAAVAALPSGAVGSEGRRSRRGIRQEEEEGQRIQAGTLPCRNSTPKRGRRDEHPHPVRFPFVHSCCRWCSRQPPPSPTRGGRPWMEIARSVAAVGCSKEHQRIYADWFNLADPDGDGRVTGAEATKFLAMSGLSLVDLKQVVMEAVNKPRNIHYKGVADLVTE